MIDQNRRDEFRGISNSSLMGRALRSPFRLIPARAAVPILQGPLREDDGGLLARLRMDAVGSGAMNLRRSVRLRGSCGRVTWCMTWERMFAGSIRCWGRGLAGQMGAVYSFEPLPRNLEFLRKHVAMNGLKNCDVVEVAVADFDREMKFESSGAPATAHLSEGGDVAVRVVRLDSLVERGEIRPPSVMKIDVELRGGGGWNCCWVLRRRSKSIGRGSCWRRMTGNCMRSVWDF